MYLMCDEHINISVLVSLVMSCIYLIVSMVVNDFLKNCIYSNWRIVTLQYCDGFCHISVWISHRYTCIHVSPPSWTRFSPPSPPHPSRLSQSTDFGCSASYIKLALVIYFTYPKVYVSMLFFQIIPPSPSPTESISLFFTSVSSLPPCT